jgi:hypothetical protein
MVITATITGEDVVKQEPLFTAGGINHYGKQYGESSKS